MPSIDPGMARTAFAFAHRLMATEFAENKVGSRAEIAWHWLRAFLLDPAYAKGAWDYEKECRDWLKREAERVKQAGSAARPEQPLFLDLPPDPPNVGKLPDYALRLLEKAARLDERLGGPAAGG